MRKLAIALVTAGLFGSAVPAYAQTGCNEDATYRGWSAVPPSAQTGCNEGATSRNSNDQPASWGGAGYRDARAQVMINHNSRKGKSKRNF